MILACALALLALSLVGLSSLGAAGASKGMRA